MTITKIRIRTYNVGFGDCFLLTFFYAGETPAERHVLIDCGSTELPVKSGPSSMEAVARKINEHTGGDQNGPGKLEMVVVTHRHADHMSGFGGKAGEIIRALKPELVVQPWTEDPKIAPNAKAPRPKVRPGQALGARAMAARFEDMHEAAARIVRERPRLMKAPGVSPGLAGQIHFLGELNIKNLAAVKNLMTMGSDRAYVKFGDPIDTAAILPGVSIDVLGPPSLAQWPQIDHAASRDAQEYWHLQARAAERTRTGKASPLFPKAPKSGVFQGARWLVPKIERMDADELLSIVRSMDDALNNTSLILLFEIGETRLLFSGDAQIENWSYALFGPDNVRVRAKLAKTNFYKVGHHGSLNATPKTMWNSLEHRGDAMRIDRLKSVVSTRAKHGSTANESEVPRLKLVAELQAKSEFFATNKAIRSKITFWKDTEINV